MFKFLPKEVKIMFIYNLFKTKGVKLGDSISLSLNYQKKEIQVQNCIISPVTGIVNFMSFIQKFIFMPHLIFYLSQIYFLL